jgi:hypothetical protein
MYNKKLPEKSYTGFIERIMTDGKENSIAYCCPYDNSRI